MRLAFSCKRRGFCPSCGARRMSLTAAQLVDRVIPHVLVRQWVLSLPIPLRLLPAAEPELVTPVLQVVQLMVTRHLLGQAGLKANESHGGTLTLIQRFGSAAYLKIYLHCVVLVGVYRVGGDAVPAFVEVAAPTVDVLHVLPAGDTFMLTDWACKARHDMFLFWATRYTAKPMLEGGLPRLPLVRRRVRGGCLLMEHH